ncbi:MAG: hypothetical protein HC910_04700 [Spirulinaceae cyanobacterium SM2_1_0]|nr:hypothetical protein [Spirulinaceae cyanobacterium SM2_1_0]
MLKGKKKNKQPAKSKRQSGQQQAAQTTLSKKEEAALKRTAKKQRQKLIQVSAVAITCFVCLGLPLVAIDPKIGAALGAGVPVMYVSYMYPRTALWLFLIYMPFGGTVLYQFMGGNALFNLAKDGFFLPACLALMLECQRKKKPIIVSKKLVGTLIFLLVCALLTMLVVNGMQQLLPECTRAMKQAKIPCSEGIPIAQGILGLKVLVGYVPLIFCAYYLIETKKHLLWLARLHLILALICCSLGIYQYVLLDSGVCEGTRNATGVDLFKASLDAKCFIGGSLTFSPSQNQIRLPGTFASPWHWAWFLIANGALTFTVAFNDPAVLWRLAGLAGMALVFVNSFISGQRIALALVPVVTVILLVMTGQLANLKRFLPIGIGLALVATIALSTNPEIIQERVDSFRSRAEASPPHAFIQEQFTWAVKEQRGVLGRGLGRATNSTRVFGPTALVETFHPKLLYEMGWMGLIAFLAFTTQVTLVTFKSNRKLKTKVLRDFGASYWVFIMIISYFPYWYPLDTDPVAVYYWLLVGVILKLPELDKQEQEQAKLAQEQEAELLRQEQARRRRALGLEVKDEVA